MQKWRDANGGGGGLEGVLMLKSIFRQLCKENDEEGGGGGM